VPPSLTPPSHIARWDLDKTYLRTEFDTLRDLVKTALERPDQKQTNPGAAMLLREMVRAGVSVHILSGSPEQMRRRLEDKLRLNARAQLFASAGREIGPRETLFGDDAEADAFVYSLYADWLRGRVAEDVLLGVFSEGRAYDDVVASALSSARMVDRGDVVERICIHLEKQTPPSEFERYGPRVVPFYNYLQAAFVVHEDGRISADAVLRVAVDFVVVHHFDGDSLARSYQDLARRGHLAGTGVAEISLAFEQWQKRERFPASREVAEMVLKLGAFGELAARHHSREERATPNYAELVRKHNPRARRK